MDPPDNLKDNNEVVEEPEFAEQDPYLDRLFTKQVPLGFEKLLAGRWLNERKAYTLTISPPQMNSKREEDLKFYIMGVLSVYKYWLVPERAGGRLHYHGCVKGNPVYIKEKMRGKALCKLEPRPGKRWIEYCFKQALAYELIGRI